MNEYIGRTRFDTLLAERRHVRGDLRMIRAALREGRLDTLTGAERAALVERAIERGLGLSDDPEDSERTRVRKTLALGRLALDMEAENQRTEQAVPTISPHPRHWTPGPNTRSAFGYAGRTTGLA